MQFGIPSCSYACTKFIYAPHQTLAFESADGGLVRHYQKDAHGAVGRGQRLFLFNDGAFAKRLQRRRNQTERIERKFELRPWRARLDLLTQAVKTIEFYPVAGSTSSRRTR